MMRRILNHPFSQMVWFTLLIFVCWALSELGS